MKKICLILAVMLVLFALSGVINLTQAEGTKDTDGYVRSLHLALRPAPKAGDSTADFLYCDIDDDMLKVEAVAWGIWNGSSYEEYSGTFEKGTTYYFQVGLVIQDDRQFNYNLDTGEPEFDEITLNGRNMASRIEDYLFFNEHRTLNIIFRMDFDTDWTDRVSKVELSFTSGYPVIGDDVSHFLSCDTDDDDMACTMVVWGIKEGNRYQPYEGVLEAGVQYYVEIDLRILDISRTFEFTEDGSAPYLDVLTLNGKNMLGEIEKFMISNEQIDLRLLLRYMLNVPPEPPVITGSNVCGEGVKISWQRVDNAEKYVVYRKNGDDWVAIEITEGLSVTDTHCTGGESYTYHVLALNSTEGTASEISNEITVQYNPFKDVKTSASYFKYLMWAYNKGVIMGTTSTTFNPNGDCKRCDLAVMLYRMYGKPSVSGQSIPFTDVKSTDYYYKAVVWAYNQGYIKGTSSTKFNPKGSITRQDMVVILWRMNGSPKVTVENPFTDVDESSYAYKAIMWAYKNKITSGTSSDKFSPKSNCLRYQLAVFLSKFNNIVHVIA